VARGTLDLRTKRGAWLFLACGMVDNTVTANGVNIYVRPLLNNGAATLGAGRGSVAEFLYVTSGTIAKTNQNTDNAAGDTAMNVDSVTNFAAGNKVMIADTGLARVEFGRLSKTATGILTLTSPSLYAHANADNDVYTNQADFWAVFVPGGALYEVIFDYGDDATGSNVMVTAKAITYDAEATA
jgi:hypothetical protein